MQYFGLLESNHPDFIITGSFENPCALGLVSSLGIVASFYILFKHVIEKKFLKVIIVIFLLVLLFTTLILSRSRAAIIGLVSGSSYYFLLHDNKSLTHSKQKIIAFIVIIFLILGLSLLRNGSVIGRLLVWRVSLNMIIDKPLFGWGFNGFQSNYMIYQAAYFKDNPDSVFTEYAGCTAYPFNEFLHIAIDSGLVGLTMVLSFLFYVFKQEPQTEISKILRACTGTILVFGLFSYPMQIPFFHIVLFIGLIIIISESTYNSVFKHLSYSILIFSMLFSTLKMSLKNYTLRIIDSSTESVMELPNLSKIGLILNPDVTDIYAQKAYNNLPDSLSRPILEYTMNKSPNPGLLVDLANIHMKLGNFRLAEDMYEKASNMVPNLIIPRYRLFVLYMEMGREREAIEMGNKIMNQRLKIRSTTALRLRHDVEQKIKGMQ